MVFRYDFFTSQAKPHFEKYLTKYKEQSNIYFLEIGAFEGMGTVWLVNNILTNSTSKIMTVDTFEGGEDLELYHLRDSLYSVFIENIKGLESKIDIIKGSSQELLRIDSMQNHRFDFVYIDGSHRSQNVMLDAIQSFRLLKKGGLLAFDDYPWKWQDDGPGIAIDTFLIMYAKEIKILSKDWQVWIEKL